MARVSSFLALHVLLVQRCAATPWYDLDLKWQQLTSGGGTWPPASTEAALVALPDGMVVFGGFQKNVSGSTSALYKLTVNGTSATWHQVATSGSLPGTRANHAMAALADNSVIVYGGNSNIDDVFRLTFESPSVGHWQEVTTSGGLPDVRYSMKALVMADDTIIVFGGYVRGASYTNDMWRLSFTGEATATWTEVSNSGVAPQARIGHAATVVGDGILVFGGQGRRRYLADVWMFTFHNSSFGIWQTLSMSGVSGSVPSWRTAMEAITAPDGSVLIFSGQGGGDELWRLTIDSPSSGSWQLLTTTGSVPQARFEYAAVLFRDDMFVFGGYHNGDLELMSDLWQLRVAEPSASTTTTTTSYSTRSIESTMTSTTDTTRSSESTLTSTSFTTMSTASTMTSTSSTESTRTGAEELCDEDFIVCPVPCCVEYVVQDATNPADPACRHSATAQETHFRIDKSKCGFQRKSTEEDVTISATLLAVPSGAGGLYFSAIPPIVCACTSPREATVHNSFQVGTRPPQQEDLADSFDASVTLYQDGSFNVSVPAPEPSQKRYYLEVSTNKPNEAIEVTRVVASPSETSDSLQSQVLLEGCSLPIPGLRLQVHPAELKNVVRLSMESFAFQDEPLLYLFFTVRRCEAGGTCGCGDDVGRRMQAAGENHATSSVWFVINATAHEQVVLSALDEKVATSSSDGTSYNSKVLRR